MNRNFNLDLVRALAILLVIVFHVSLMTLLYNPITQYTAIGAYGVDVFFCLSGFLIGSLYWKEYKQTGSVNIYNFWARRWSRTVPLYFIFLTISYLSVYAVRKEEFNVLYLVFGQNYLTEMPFYLVSWSLCIEEHFYLLMPLVLTGFLFLIKNKRFLLVFSCILIVLPLLFRFFAIKNLGEMPPFGYYTTASHFKLDGLMLGVLFAYFNTYKINIPLPKPLYLHILSGITLLSSLFLSATAFYIYGYFMMSLAVTMSIFSLKNTPLSSINSRLGKIIEYISISSYTLYLSHPLSIHAALAVLKKMGIQNSALKFSFTAFVVFFIGFLAYEFIEKRLLKLRDQYIPALNLKQTSIA